MTTLTVATYNIHKGFSQFNRRVVLHDLRERLRELDVDIVFLQEVQGEHLRHPQRHSDYPAVPQHEFLADEFWEHHAYGMNAVYEEGHHGNAILSRFPIVLSSNKDVSAHRFESRGLLHCEIELGGQSFGGLAAGSPPAYPLRVEREGGGEAAGHPPAYPLRVHCLCAHFGLTAKGRRTQLRALVEHVLGEIPDDAPLIIAGDFNDWRNELSEPLARELGVLEAFQAHAGEAARSYPSGMPLFRLDRIYVRGFDVRGCDVHAGGKWRRMSDHAALSARLERE
jgi:endonuclease/exonuclease/phosphatase family metal-dependent hydrolase